MTPQELAVLGRYVKALCPAQKFDEYTPDAWLMVLGEFEFEDCKTVLPRIAQGRPFIAPSDIATAVRELRARRHESANLIYEPRPDEGVSDFLARARGANRDAASGNVIPIRPGIALPPGQAALPPPSIANVVQQVREERAGKHPALAVACPWEACSAQVGAWCEKRTPSSSKPKAVPGFVHPARCDAVGAQFVAVVPELSVQERSEREFSRALAAKRAAEEAS